MGEGVRATGRRGVADIAAKAALRPQGTLQTTRSAPESGRFGHHGSGFCGYRQLRCIDPRSRLYSPQASLA